jgi:8-oxo-dGTP diphosphatase
MKPAAYDWSTWEPGIRATLLFVVKDGRILLIEKKRGLGAGKINGPGGKIDPGETPIESAIRETQEELCVTPLNPRKCGELRFAMTMSPHILCHVFRADEVTGEPRETEEAIPLWTDVDAIPYARMWEDDRHWLPYLLCERGFLGRFVFREETMQSMDLRTDVVW